MKRLITLFTALLLISFSTMAQTYEVTFVVDMNEVEGAFTTPEVNGSWDGWCGGCTPLSDPDMDGIWTATKTLDAGYYEYKFAYDSWSGDETLTPGSPCTVTTGEFTNRFIDVTEDVVLDEVCYGFCEACADVSTVAVTFSVNMNDVADPYTTPEVNGSWDGWCGGCTPLSDPDGDGVWTGTRMLEPGYYEYKFAADAWSIDESLTEGDPCTVTADGFTNRFIEVTDAVELDPVCWATCDICEGVALEQMDLPVTFDEEGVDYGVIGFGGAEASFIVEDPTDPTNTVVEATKSATAELWAGTTVTNAAEEGFATPIPFTMDDTQMSVRVWSPDAGIQVRLKVEDYTDPTKSVETEATSTVAGDWEVLIFDFANEAAGTAALNLDYDYNKASIFFNFGVDGATAGEKTYYFDDIEFIGGGGAPDMYEVTFAVNMNDVVDPFTTPEVNGSWDGWCGGCTPLSDPDGDGVWTATKVLEEGFYEYKFAADGWAIDESLTEGDPCTITTDGFTNRFIDLTADVVLDPVCWATCDICEGVVLEQMDLPVTFDEEGVDYGVIGFGGAEASFIVEDPTDPTNTVVEVTKSAVAELWAGTTVTNAAEVGFATPIPFTVDDTKMSVRVWSPDADIQVRLKVEDYTDPTKSVETEATSTVAGDWEVLIFDFANEAAGTAALNLDYDYNKASIFFNFGVDGATAGEKTYYFDDIEFYLGEPVCETPGGFELTAVTATTASFDWSDVALSDQYVLTVFRADLSARTKIRPTASEGTVTGLEPSTEYGARVKTVCYDEGLRSENTETIFFTTDPLRLGSAGENISVFPNPTSGMVTLSTTDIEAGSMIIVTNLSGQVVYQGTLNSNNQEIDLTSLSDGLYSITVANSNMNRTFQISIIK